MDMFYSDVWLLEGQWESVDEAMDLMSTPVWNKPTGKVRGGEFYPPNIWDLATKLCCEQTTTQQEQLGDIWVILGKSDGTE